MADPLIMPIEIRPDYFVQIMGIPHDLTAEEARKIAAVVLAMGTPGYVIAVDPSPEALLKRSTDYLSTPTAIGIGECDGRRTGQNHTGRDD